MPPTAMPPTGRLAPTPSGRLHLGNALAFGAAWLSARNGARPPPSIKTDDVTFDTLRHSKTDDVTFDTSGRLLLRIEDLDQGRARDEIAQSQRDDLRWLGIDWDEEVSPQSRRTYPLDGIPTYRCACSRATRLSWGCRCRFLAGDTGAWRFRTPEGPVSFTDRARGPLTLPPGDDPILQRADGTAAYPLAVIVDDARDGVTEVVRGADLLDATPVQVRLHEALGLPLPTYLHVPVLLGPDGRKLSKSHGSTELVALRATGWTPERVWDLLLPFLGAEPPFRDARMDLAQMPAGPLTVTG